MAELVSIKRNVDVSPGQAAPAVFHCSQGDVGSKIILGLLNNGTAYSIPSGVTVTIEGSESNGSIFTPISATASGSDITFYLTGEMTAVAGPAICQAVLKSGSNILGTANFTLEVESSPMGADAPPVFTDAGWTWMLNKLTTEFVPALGDNIIDAIGSKADQSDLTALSNTVAGHTGSIAVLNNTVNNLNQSVTENRQNIALKLDKNQGKANAGKYLKVQSSGQTVPVDLIDDSLLVENMAADSKATGDALNTKLNKNQGANNSGKYLKVGANGNVETAATDTTLSVSGDAADAKTVGDELDDLKANLNDLERDVEILEHDVKFKTGLYGAKWDRTTNYLTRTRDAVGITTDTTNFAHNGSINANYSNPFDNIYPWSEMKVVNVDLAKYRTGNYSLKQCIVAVYGDPDFTYVGSDTLFVGRYVPEFWHTKITDDSGDEYLVSQFARNGYTHVDEYIRGISFCTDAENSHVTSGAGVPLTNVAASTIHTRAKNSGFTLMDIYNLDAEIVLYLVEYANMNSQQALGDGCSSCYRQNASDVIANVTTTNSVTVFTVPYVSALLSLLNTGAQLSFGASTGATTYKAIVKSAVSDGSNITVTLDREVAITNGMILSVHGFSTCEFDLLDDSVGNASGYIGTNSHANAWYRGALLYANRYSYILGIYRQTGTNHIWVCPTDKDADDYDALNTSVHKDTGTALPSLSEAAWQTVGGNAQNIDGLSAFMATGESSGSSSAPVGDQQYAPLISTANTVLLFGCSAGRVWRCGVFGGFWAYASGSSLWLHSALPILKNPLQRGLGE